MDGQISIFDFMNEDITEFDVLLEYAKIGSGFADGKKRIFEFFVKITDKSQREKFLKKEYGIGGFGCGIKKPLSINGYDNDSSGVKINWYDENFIEHTEKFSYSQLEEKIQILIDKNDYLI